jgi:hypothetical protein
MAKPMDLISIMSYRRRPLGMRPSRAPFWSFFRGNDLWLLGPNPSFRGCIQHVPLAEIANPLHKGGAVTVDAVAADPAEGHSLADGIDGHAPPGPLAHFGDHDLSVADNLEKLMYQ